VALAKVGLQAPQRFDKSAPGRVFYSRCVSASARLGRGSAASGASPEGPQRWSKRVGLGCAARWYMLQARRYPRDMCIWG